jgi:hypothetical protein
MMEVENIEVMLNDSLDNLNNVNGKPIQVQRALIEASMAQSLLAIANIALAWWRKERKK